MDILDASGKSAKAKTVADVWFEQDIFKKALDEDNNDEEFELERKLTALKSDGVTVRGKISSWNPIIDISLSLSCLIGKPLKGILKNKQGNYFK